MAQVAGPYDLLGAVRRSLPKALKILDGETIDGFEWYLADELPVTQPNTKGKPLPNPHGIFRILPPIRIRNNVAADANGPYRLIPTAKSEAITFNAGTLDYEVTEQDISSITSVKSYRVADNVIVNGEFTDYPSSPGDPPGWTAGPGVTNSRETVDAHAGPNSLRITADSVTANLYSYQTLPPLAAGVPIWVSVWCKIRTGTRGAKLVVYNVTDNVEESTAANGTSTWLPITSGLTPEAGKTYQIRLVLGAGGAIGDSVLFDTIYIIPQHTFTQGVDYESSGVDGLAWLDADTPDDNTDFSIDYMHRMYAPRAVMDSMVTIRAILKCQAYAATSRQYPMSTLAAVLGNYLEMNLRYLSGSRMVRPADTDEPYTETVTMGRVLSSGPLPMDESGSLASWFVDFTLNVGGIFEGVPVQSILDIPFEIVDI